MGVVTVATLNLFHEMGRWPERRPLLIDQLVALAPDIIGLQEVNLTTDQAMAICREANERLGEPGYTVFHLARPGASAHRDAQAVMARLPVEAHEALDYLTHECVAQRLRLRLADGARLDFYNTHLHFPPSEVQARLEQARKLLAWTDTFAGADATVVVGDFNAYAGEPTVELMKSRFVSAHEAVHGGEPERTWPTSINDWDPSAPGCLDYVFVEGAEVLDARLAFHEPHADDETLFPSDHLGVMARLRVGS